MLKQTIKYTDFNDVEKTRDLYFNITKTELLENLDLKNELEAISKNLVGIDPKAELEDERVVEMLNLVKKFIKIGYGVRSEDGETFRKSDELLGAFKDSAAYDEFVFGLFSDADKAMAFLLGVMPKGLIDEAEAQMQATKAVLPAHDTIALHKEAPKPEHSAMTREEMERALAEMRAQESPTV